jgi:hypothetical protein
VPAPGHTVSSRTRRPQAWSKTFFPANTLVLRRSHLTPKRPDISAMLRPRPQMAACMSTGGRVLSVTVAGHGLDKYPLWTGEPYSTDALSTDARARHSLVEKAVDSHPCVVTHVTTRHFYVTDDRTAHVNIDLAERTQLASTKATRTVVTISTTVLGHLSMNLPAEYAVAGIRSIEVRLSPVGRDDEGIRKTSKAFSFLDEFRERGIGLTRGLSGNIGQAALALGHADAYSVGVGLLDKVNHAQTIAREGTGPGERPRR